LPGFLSQVEFLADIRQWRHERFHEIAGGPATGFVTYPHAECEPLKFEFDQRGRFSGWVKTQFAGPDTHIEVVRFLRDVRLLLGKFGVRDEGEYWETESEETLRGHIDTINGVIREMAETNPSIRIRVHELNGLITDCIQ
jgi:hypothetical protein